MKAVRVRAFGPPSVLRIEEVPDPKPGRGEVLVRVKAAGVNPVEAYMRAGTYPRKPPLPWTPGSDGAGVVVAVGAEATRVQEGDRVYTTGSATGTYAEMCVCREADVRPLPARLSFAEGAALHVPWATAWRALFQKARGRAGETVLVHGATGGVGTAAVQLAVARGLDVIGTGGTDRGRKAVAELGAKHVLDHTRPKHLEEIATITDGRGVDVIVEFLADRNLDADLDAVAVRGRIVVVGSRGTVLIDPRKAMSRDATIYGMSLMNATGADVAEAHDGIAGGLADGSLTPVVREEIPLAEAARAHEALMAPGALGKIALVP